MKLERWTLLIEAIGSIGIILTLVILIFEVRANTELSRISAYQNVTQDYDDFRTLILTDPGLLDLYASRIDRIRRGEAPWPQSRDETSDARNFWRLVLAIDISLGAHERAYLAYRAGVIHESEWTRIRRQACSQFLEIPENLMSGRLLQLTDGFAEYLQTECVE